MRQITRLFKKSLNYLRAIPKRKHYIEFITASLSVPVLATAILINVGNLKDANETKETQPEQIIISYAPDTPRITQEESREIPITNTAVCTKKVGPVSIAYPAEGDVVTDNPLTVHVEYESDEFCEAVWSYRINNGTWSAYDNSSFSLYNLSNGPKTLEVRVKSIASPDEKLLKRTFEYQGGEIQPTPTHTPTPTVTPSGQ